MPSFSSMKVHPLYTKPDERFPYVRYQSLGLAQIILGVISLALGTYDLVLHLHPEWYSKQCDYWKSEPCKGVHLNLFFWTPIKDFSWILVATPIYTGVMFCISGFVGTCTCETDCTSQRCLCHAFMSLSLLNSVIFGPATVVVSFLQGVYAVNHHLHTLRTVLPLCSGGIGMIGTVVCFVTMCLCCCFTEYDAEIPLVKFEDDLESIRSSHKSGHVTHVVPNAQSISQGVASVDATVPRGTPPQAPTNGTWSPDLLKAYIRHLSDVSNMMAELLIQTSPHATLPRNHQVNNSTEMTPAHFVNPFTIVENEADAALKHRDYRRKTGTRRGTSFSSQSIGLASGSTVSGYEGEPEIPGQASPPQRLLTLGMSPEPKRSTSVV